MQKATVVTLGRFLNSNSLSPERQSLAFPKYKRRVMMGYSVAEYLVPYVFGCGPRGREALYQKGIFEPCLFFDGFDRQRTCGLCVLCACGVHCVRCVHGVQSIGHGSKNPHNTIRSKHRTGGTINSNTQHNKDQKAYKNLLRSTTKSN